VEYKAKSSMINLLPPSYKEELQGEEHFRLVLILGMLIVIFFVCLSLALLAIRVYLSGEIEVQQILVESQSQDDRTSRVEQVQKLNGDIAEVSSFYENKVLISDVILRISDVLPESVYITSLSYTPVFNSKSGKADEKPSKVKIALTGFAPRTEDLLQIRTSLEQDPLFGNFHFPPSNWIRATNIDFSFDFEL